MVTGSYRWKDVIEVWDLRKMARTRVIDWDGTGDLILVPNEPDSEASHMEESAEETKSVDQVSLSGTSLANTETTAGARRKGKEPEAAPYLYTTKFNRE